MPQELRYKECPSGHPVPGHAYFLYHKYYSGGAEGPPTIEVDISKFLEGGDRQTLFSVWSSYETVKEAIQKWATTPELREVGADALDGVSYTGEERNAKCLKCRHYWIDKNYSEYDHFGCTKVMCELEIPRSFYCKQFIRRNKFDDFLAAIVEEYDSLLFHWTFMAMAPHDITWDQYESFVDAASQRCFELYLAAKEASY
jgi:hypothetical protein